MARKGMLMQSVAIPVVGMKVPVWGLLVAAVAGWYVFKPKSAVPVLPDNTFPV